MKSEHAENYIFLASIILVAALVGLIFLPELDVIVLGITFAVFFRPLYRWLVKKMPRQESLAALLIVFLTALIIFVPLVFFGFQVFGEAQGLYVTISSGGNFPVVSYVQGKIHEIAPALNINLGVYLQQLLGVVVNDLGSIFSGVMAAFLTVFLSFFALYYFLKDGDRLREAVLARSPFPRDRTVEVIAKLRLIMSSIIQGTLFIAVLYGIFVGVGFFAFGLPSAVLWGAVTAIASFIPVVGVFLVVVPAIADLLVFGHIAAAIGFTVWMALVGLFIENFLRPKLIGRKANIHPLLILFSVVGGLSFFGPVGILLGPLALGLLLALLELYPIFKKE